MYAVIIKANRHEAAQMAADRGIPMAFIGETSNGETVGKVHDRHVDKVQAWFSEDLDHKAPYPHGSLLAYSHQPSFL